ncbi:hypothetical protein DSO57_1006709 [Entomophthora muscae]|uniref:Uncharacterized protein n=1 Tax=Entomophthora muscae TaxID=34485 RepID=A0ACC2UGN9_9FUNG|nr:hypothetical protein DSO57_1006709 [Entomophthora muscae]
MSDVPSVYGMGCATNGDTLFALGGNQGTLGFRLDFNLPAISNWTSFDVDEQIGMYPSVISTDKGVIVVGGDRSLDGSPVRFFSNETLKLTTGPSMARREVGMLMKASLVQNDLVPTEYISFGGKQVQMKLPALRIYDSAQEKWRLVGFKSKKVYDEDRIVAIANGTLYVLTAGEDGTAAETIRTYNLQSKSWKSKKATGTPAPLIPGLAVTQNSTSIFVVFSQSIFILNLATLEWTENEIHGLEGRTHGCLAYSKGYLIHAFGLATSTQSSSSTQLIDLENMSLVSPAPEPQQQNSSPDNKLLYMFLGISSGLIFIILLVYFLRRRNAAKARPQREF